MQINEKHDAKEHVSFRIDASSLRRLQQDAEKNNTSLNTLVNQILKKYAEWDADFGCAGLISIWKIIPIKLLEKYSDNEIIQIAKEVSEARFRPTTILLKGRYDVESLLQVIEDWMKSSNYPYKHDVNSSMHKIVVQHDMGKKWALLTLEIWKAALEQLEIKAVSTDAGEDHIILEFNSYKQ